jgi:hypothetical protein
LNQGLSAVCDTRLARLANEKKKYEKKNGDKTNSLVLCVWQFELDHNKDVDDDDDDYRKVDCVVQIYVSFQSTY